MTGLNPSVVNKSLAADPNTGPVVEVVTSGRYASFLPIGVGVVDGEVVGILENESSGKAVEVTEADGTAVTQTFTVGD